MDNLMTLFNCSEDGIPIPFDVGAVGVEFGFQPRVLEDTFALSNIFGD